MNDCVTLSFGNGGKNQVMSREEHPFKNSIDSNHDWREQTKKANGGKLVFFLFFLPFYSEKAERIILFVSFFPP